MGVTITSCWVCGKTLKAMGDTDLQSGPVTTWEVCEDCGPRVYRTAGESRVLPPERRHGSELRRVYVCAPFSGDIVGNTRRARDVALKLAMEASHDGKELPCVFVPHLAFQYTVTESMESYVELYREWALRMCVCMVGVCDELIVCGKEVTKGMELEMDEAMRMGVTITKREDL